MSLRFHGPSVIPDGVFRDVKHITDLTAGYDGEGGRPFLVESRSAGDIAFVTEGGTTLTLTVANNSPLDLGRHHILVKSILPPADGTTVTAVYVGYLWL